MRAGGKEEGGDEIRMKLNFFEGAHRSQVMEKANQIVMYVFWCRNSKPKPVNSNMLVVFVHLTFMYSFWIFNGMFLVGHVLCLLACLPVYLHLNAHPVFFCVLSAYFSVGACRKNKSFRPRERGKKGLKNLQSVKTLAGRTQSFGTVGKRKTPMTVTAQFQLSLHSLMDTLNMANPYFIRCIKSNGHKVWFVD